MKLTILMLFSAICFLFSAPSFTEASDSVVSLSATVVAPPPIIDLDLSGINPDAVPVNDTGLVKGVSTSSEDDSSVKIIMLELGAVFIAVLFFCLIKRKRRIFLAVEQKLINNSI